MNKVAKIRSFKGPSIKFCLGPAPNGLKMVDYVAFLLRI
jgi:hypothetical protein